MNLGNFVTFTYVMHNKHYCQRCYHMIILTKGPHNKDEKRDTVEPKFHLGPASDRIWWKDVVHRQTQTNRAGASSAVLSEQRRTELSSVSKDRLSRWERSLDCSLWSSSLPSWSSIVQQGAMM